MEGGAVASAWWVSLPGSRRATGLVLGLPGLGVAMRVWNALRYPLDLGYDAPENWQYIQLLMQRWVLPAPESGWSLGRPPFFYALAAALGRMLGRPEKALVVHATRLVSASLGLLAIGASVALVRRLDPQRPHRALLAGGLLLFLPVHLYMSAMLSEEISASALGSLAVVVVAWDLGRKRPAASALRLAAGAGLLAGLALLTKLSGVLVVLAGSLAYGIAGLRGRGGERRRALLRTLVFGGVASLVGGWFYLRNLLVHGYLYPHGLAVHAIHYLMPPGQRSLADYLRFPVATFTQPDLLAPPLLHSVWGSTYLGIWFDAHRQFLPLDAPGLGAAAAGLLVLGLVPTAAFGVGAFRAARRALRHPGGPETLLLGLTLVTFAGYVAFTLENPWFVTLKGSFLLGLAVPFAVFASDALAAWTERRRLAGPVWAALALLVLLVVPTFTWGAAFEKPEAHGIVWWQTSGATP